MRRFIAGLCCLIVGLQMLIGVPAAVSVAILSLWSGGGGFGTPATIPPPRDLSISFPPATPQSPALEAVLESRQRIGSPLADTFLTKDDQPGQAERDFADAFKFVASEARVNQFEIPLAVNPPTNV